MTLPKILHRVWICPPGPEMPEEFKRYGERLRALHPEWRLIDWATTSELEPLVNAALYADPPAAHLHRCRADVVRLEALWKLGGIYVDTDVEPVRALDPLLERMTRVKANAFIVWSANRWQGRRLVSNAVIGAAPGHPWIGSAMAELPRSVARHAGEFLAKMTVHYLTDLLGPLDANGVSKDGVLVLEESSFYPRSIPDRRKGKAVSITPETFAIHHWANSRKVRA